MTGSIHRLSPSDALASLHSTAGGLSAADAQRRQGEFGLNQLTRVRPRRAILQLFSQFTHFFALILWAAASLAAVAAYRNPGSGMGTLSAAIVAVIVVNGVFSYWHERRAHKTIAALQRLLPQSVRARRDGHLIELPNVDLVPGDVVELQEGDHVPADCRLLEAFDVKIDNATLTGESIPQGRSAKADTDISDDVPAQRRCMVLAGTSVVAGRAVALVVATGMRTEFGRIARLTQTAPETVAPLHYEIERLSRLIAILSVLLGLALFVAGRLLGLPFASNFVFAIGVIVANVPEGLLPTLTLSMAMAAERMAARQTLVRHPPAVQTLGAATVICTDKTGTLTESRMVGRRLFLGDRFHEVVDLGSQPDVRTRHRRLFEGAALCETVDDSRDDGRLRGDPMEVALVEVARAGLLQPCELDRVDLIPFSADRRRMATVHMTATGFVVFVKGALEAVLPRCTTRTGEDHEEPLTESLRRTIVGAEATLAADGLRVLAFAYRELQTIPERDRLEDTLTFAGLVGLHDPPRREVPAAIARCRDAGVKVVMVTGDHPQTGLAVAKEIGLVRGSHPTVITGHDLDNLSAEQLTFMLEEAELVFARVSAEQKLRIVRALQLSGAIVAVTGDGVNDAPALKAADIGVAMGITGTDVTREAADVVLLDDNFASIVAAIEEGRGVFDNIRKFTTYVLTSNIPELVPYLLFVLLRIPLPLTIIQVLAVDLGTDLLPGLGLGAERPAPDVMTRPPSAQRLVDRRLLTRAYLRLGVIEAAAAMAAYAFVLGRSGWQWGMPLAATDPVYRQATTACLTGIVIAQVANVYASRSEFRTPSVGELFTNRIIVAGVVFELLLVAAIDYTSLGNAVFGTAPISWLVWLVPVPFAVALLSVDGLAKRRWQRQARETMLRLPGSPTRTADHSKWGR